MQPFPWTCPFCSRRTTITDSYYSRLYDDSYINAIRLQTVRVRHTFIVCPAPDCRQLSFWTELFKKQGADNYSPLHSWHLLPESTAKVFPSYIPETILADYREACRIKDLSPKASATLSRRCLQGMIRDFWNIKKARLKDEIDALQDRVSGEEWVAIDALRKVGNIGAHMEKDINMIVDVEPQEAELLLGLIETLLADWYVARHEKRERLKAITLLASEKSRVQHSDGKADPIPPPSIPTTSPSP